MHDAGIGVCVAAPGRVRYLANAEGLLAKTDSIDAELTRRFAEKILLPLQSKPDPDARKLREMSDFRRMLSDDIVKTNNRLELAEGDLREQLQSQLTHLKGLKKKPSPASSVSRPIPSKAATSKAKPPFAADAPMSATSSTWLPSPLHEATRF